jgi:hypothetical protein
LGPNRRKMIDNDFSSDELLVLFSYYLSLSWHLYLYVYLRNIMFNTQRNTLHMIKNVAYIILIISSFFGITTKYHLCSVLPHELMKEQNRIQITYVLFDWTLSHSFRSQLIFTSMEAYWFLERVNYKNKYIYAIAYDDVHFFSLLPQS